MHGVVPAAGRGSRMGALTADRPKPLVEVAGEPLLTHVFRALAPHVDEYVVVVGYLGDRIRERYGDSFDGRPVTYVEQPERLGLADAVCRTEPVVDGPFLQLNGDNVLRGDLGAVVETRRDIDADAVLLVQEVSGERAKRGGVVVEEDGEVTAVIEKPDAPPSRLATTGCYAFSQRVFDAGRAIEPSDRGEYEVADAVEWLLANGGEVAAVRLDGWRVNVNTPADVRRAERQL